eukprot:TRINITY_DN75941_c0_g1_i1.p1 TRINITY_DN75941_c0_g1~~TRINITY_DN75941_c0_g1_i1.p1  ORF type:complete len:286 (+),score=64.21 TRINITY_DN75941_c0_g1_i1:80-859(+)
MRALCRLGRLTVSGVASGVRSAAAASAPAAAAAAPKKGTPLLSSAKVNVGKLAGAVSERVRTEGQCYIQAVGPDPCHNALKAVIIAGTYLESAAAGADVELAVTPEKSFLEGRVAPSGRTTDTAFLNLLVRQLPAAPAASAAGDAASAAGASEAPKDVVVGSDTNVGKAAGLVATRMQENGAVTIGCMGAASSAKALKAVIVAQKYLADYLGEDNVLAASVRTEKFRTQGGEDMKRLVLSCRRAPAPTTAPPSLRGRAG